MNEDHKLTPELTEAVDALAENLLASEPFLALEGAYLRLREDAQARDLQQRFRQAEATLRQRQANRSMTQVAPHLAAIQCLPLKTPNVRASARGDLDHRVAWGFHADWMSRGDGLSVALLPIL